MKISFNQNYEESTLKMPFVSYDGWETLMVLAKTKIKINSRKYEIQIKIKIIRLQAITF